jgi:predicted deacetylase
VTGFEFVVSIHDVAPGTAAETGAWVDDLDRLGVPATLLVIPGEFAGGKALAADPGLIGYLHEVAARGHELSLHGYRHEGVPGGPAWRRQINQVMARGAGEFWTLTEDEARARLMAGRSVMSEIGIKVTGFTPPGWLASPGTRQALAALGFRYWTSQLAVHDLRERSARRMPALSHRPGGSGERTGARLMVAASRGFSRAGLPFRIALHPADLGRPGLRAAALAAIEIALDAGGRPLTYESLVGA